jgi:hypothetical protein
MVEERSSGFGIAGFVLAVIAIAAAFPMAVLFAESLKLAAAPVTIWVLGFVLSLMAMVLSFFRGKEDGALGHAGIHLGLIAAIIYGVVFIVVVSIT